MTAADALEAARAAGAAPDPFDPDPSLDGHRMHLRLGVPFDTPLRICFAMMRELWREDDPDPDEEEMTDDERRDDALRQRNDRMRKE